MDVAKVLLVVVVAVVHPWTRRLGQTVWAASVTAFGRHSARLVSQAVITILLIVVLLHILRNLGSLSYLLDIVLALTATYFSLAVAHEADNRRRAEQALNRSLRQSKAAYAALLNEKSTLASQLRSSRRDSAAQRPAAQQLQACQAQLRDAQDRIDDLERLKADNELEVKRLTELNKSLRSQLADYDSMLGEQRKKTQ
ncbi:Endoplasmic reticulum transmembrane protein [Plasmodiophora brassicae]|uniref:Uncharacterized protein n=1 Tax=Plasmodiophora brassicae TaxID=37360 RepID=A0A0G4IHY2_PLABS|nr:hypothetical protein PBRA_003649 [Plasmodiophora brassicae]SPQ94168.1 unnamed protein product [Plasmodiophora brassicae]